MSQTVCLGASTPASNQAHSTASTPTSRLFLAYAASVPSRATLSSQDLVGTQNQLTSPQVANRLFNPHGRVQPQIWVPSVIDQEPVPGCAATCQHLWFEQSCHLKAFEQAFLHTSQTCRTTWVWMPPPSSSVSQPRRQTFRNKVRQDYDPNKADAKLMGIDQNYATQNEETPAPKISVTRPCTRIRPRITPIWRRRPATHQCPGSPDTPPRPVIAYAYSSMAAGCRWNPRGSAEPPLLIYCT